MKIADKEPCEEAHNKQNDDCSRENPRPDRGILPDLHADRFPALRTGKIRGADSDRDRLFLFGERARQIEVEAPAELFHSVWWLPRIIGTPIAA
jgi:hypothetical protein